MSTQAPVFGLLARHRRYRCEVCGHEHDISTNHTGRCYPHCPGCSWRSNFVEPGHPHNFTALDKQRPAVYVGPPATPEEINPHAKRGNAE